MSLEDRFRQTLTDAISEVKTRLEGEFDTAITDDRVDADRERAAALATAEAARLEVVRLTETATAEAEHRRQESEKALQSATADAERRRQESDAALASARSEASATVDAIRAELRDAQAAAMRHREEYDATMARQREEAELASSRLRAEFDVTSAEAREGAEAAQASLRAEAQAAATLYRHAVDAHQAASVRMLESVRALDGATSLTEVLDALTIGASKEAGRAAMLVVKGERLIGWKTIGFGALDREPRSIESSTSDAGAIAEAVNTGRPAVTGGASTLAGPAFGDAASDPSGLAVPLLVAGRPVAVLYADPGQTAPAAGWTSPVEVLVRHASRCLEGLAVQRATASRAGGARVAQSA